MGILSQALNAEVDNQTDLTAEFKLGDQAFKVGSKPLTPADFDHVNSAVAQASAKMKIGYVPFQQDPTNFTGQVTLLIRKTRLLDDDGALTDDKAFDIKDKPMLMRLGADKVSDMFTDLFKDQITTSVDDEDAEDQAVKN